jgi:hypothetical protein
VSRFAAAAIAVILAAYAIRRLFTEPPIVPLPCVRANLSCMTHAALWPSGQPSGCNAVYRAPFVDDIDWLQEFREAERRLAA